MMADFYDLEAERAAKAAAAAEKRRNANGAVAPTLGNAVIALRAVQEMAGAFAWNDFSARPEIVRQLPGGRVAPLPRPLSDLDVSAVTIWLNQTAEMAVSSRTTAEAIRVIADATHFHPVRSYLDRLEWDGTPRIYKWLTYHLGAEDSRLHQVFGARWLIGMVARIFQPGCQFDTALVFESPQGLGKSTTLRTLGGEWFTDYLPDLTSKDAMQQLQGVWVVEIAELDSFRRAETHRIKSFLSTRIDRFRPPYGTMPADFPRQCGFGGTINPDGNGYLRDVTGARRFWIVACGTEWEEGQKADTCGLAAVRDQLWAEATARYQAGEPWHLDTAELEREQAEAADDRMESDAWEGRVQAYLRGSTSVRMDQILGPDCLCLPIDRWSRGAQMQAGFVLKSLKWTRKRVRTSAKSWEWRYFAP